MGTWGVGVFENDDALDFVADMMDDLFKTIETFFAGEEPSYIEEGEGEIIPRIKMMSMLARLGREAGDPIIRCAPPEQATIEQWRTSYLAGFEEEIDDYDPDDEYRDARRAEIEAVFEELIQEADLLDEMMAEAEKEQVKQEDEFLAMAEGIDDDSEVLLRSAEIYTGRQEWKKAVDRYRRALELGLADEELGFAYNNLAWSLAQLEEFKESEEYARKAIDSESSFPYFYGTLGYVFYRTGKMEEALAQYDRALSEHDNAEGEDALFDPSLAETHYWRSRVHDDLGNEEACEKDLMMIKLLGCKPPDEE